MRIIAYKIIIIVSFMLVMKPSWGFYCSEPSAPFYVPSKPSVPFCVSIYTKTHTCSAWQINSYNSAIEIYNNEVALYINQLQLYVDEAVDFAECEIRNLDY